MEEASEKRAARVQNVTASHPKPVRLHYGYGMARPMVTPTIVVHRATIGLTSLRVRVVQGSPVSRLPVRSFVRSFSTQPSVFREDYMSLIPPKLEFVEASEVRWNRVAPVDGSESTASERAIDPVSSDVFYMRLQNQSC